MKKSLITLLVLAMALIAVPAFAAHITVLSSNSSVSGGTAAIGCSYAATSSWDVSGAAVGSIKGFTFSSTFGIDPSVTGISGQGNVALTGSFGGSTTETEGFAIGGSKYCGSANAFYFDGRF
jgi:hypothetical protein